MHGWEPALDRLGWWALAALLLILIAYGPFFASYDHLPVARPFRLF